MRRRGKGERSRLPRTPHAVRQILRTAERALLRATTRRERSTRTEAQPRDKNCLRPASRRARATSARGTTPSGSPPQRAAQRDDTSRRQPLPHDCQRGRCGESGSRSAASADRQGRLGAQAEFGDRRRGLDLCRRRAPHGVQPIAHDGESAGFGGMANLELLCIDDQTQLRHFRNELRWTLRRIGKFTAGTSDGLQTGVGGVLACLSQFGGAATGKSLRISRGV